MDASTSRRKKNLCGEGEVRSKAVFFARAGKEVRGKVHGPVDSFEAIVTVDIAASRARSANCQK
jgi:hypothetical protein